MRSSDERRRVQRVRLIQPLQGTVGTQKILVLDVSLLGLRIAHQQPLGEAGAECRLIFEWQGNKIELRCRVVRSELQRPAAGPARMLYQSGLEIVFAQPLSREHLASLIHEHISRGRSDKKPASRASTATTSPFSLSAMYIRHDFVGGQWRTAETTDTTQPMSGFTIAAEESFENVLMLREAFIAADPSLRHVIRKMAELSITYGDGPGARSCAQ